MDKQPQIKILNIIMDDRIGGPQLRIIRIAKRLREDGIETIVAIPANTGEFQQLLKKEKIRFYELDNFRRPRLTLAPMEHIRYISSFIPSILKLKRIIKEESIDIVHQNDIKQIQGPIAARLANTKGLWHLNAITVPLASKPFIPLVYFLANKVVASSFAIGERYFDPGRKIFNRNYEVVYPPVDVKEFHPGLDSKSFKKEFSLNGACPVIGMVGNLNFIKGHKYFIEAAKSIKEKYGKAKFIIVGKVLENRMDYYNKLKILASGLGLENDIIFTDTRNDVPEALSSLDIFILPSLSESFGMALAEAMAMEIPCIATNVGGIPEIITNKENGLLVPPKASGAIAGAVEFLLKNPDKAKDIGRKAREKIIANFSLDICAERQGDIYRSMLKNHH